MGVELPGSWVGPEERRPAPSCFAHNPFEGQNQHCRALLGPGQSDPSGTEGQSRKGRGLQSCSEEQQGTLEPQGC